MKRTITSIFAIMLALVMVLSLAACGGSSSKGEEETTEKTEMSREEMLKISQTTTINAMMEEAMDNIARAENTYVGNTYTVWGKIVKISKDSIYLKGNITCNIDMCAYFPSDEIVNFNDGDAIQIVGTIEEIAGEKKYYEDEDEDGNGYVQDRYVYVMKNAHFVNDIYEIKNADIYKISYDTSTGKYDCDINDENFGRIRINTGKISNLQWQHEDSYSVSASGKMSIKEGMLTMDDSNFVITKK